MRLEFYENWLSPAGMRDGRIGLAPLGAVLSFLHREEPPANGAIARRAGTCAAEWTYEEISGLRRWFIRQLPLGLRVRAALGLGKRLVMATVRQSKVKTRVLADGAVVEIHSALFDQLRDPASVPMRAFYAAALQRLFALCSIEANVSVANEHEAGWSLAVTVRGPAPAAAIDAA